MFGGGGVIEQLLALIQQILFWRVILQCFKIPGYVTSNDTMIEMERIGKEEIKVPSEYYAGICLEGLRKTTETSGYRCPSLDSI
jgi:hypothetical protein